MKYSIKGVIVLVALAFGIKASAQQSVQDGIKMYQYNKWQSAERILEPLAATNPKANYYLGLCYIIEGKLEKANAAFSKFPEDAANISGTARVAFAQKNAARGMQIAKELAAKSKKKEWIQEKFAADAITYSEGGDYLQAIAWYKDALTKADEAETHIGLGDAFRKVPGGGGEAMTNYESVTEKDNKNSLAYSRIGDLWYEAHNYQSALDNYAKAKDADNTNPLPYMALADAYARSGKFKMALDNIQPYIKLSDNTLADKMKYLRLMYLAQSYCEAAKYAQELMNGQSLSGDEKIEVTGITGFSQAECGDSMLALQNLHTYFHIVNPSKITPGAYIQFGKLFLKMGMLDSAGYYYNKGIADDTAHNKTDIYRTIAEAFKTKKDYCKSADWYNNLIRANPETQPSDYAWRGIMYYYCKDLDKALKSFQDFVAKYPDQPSGAYWLGRTAAAIDSDAATGGAVEYYKKWLEKVGPNYEKKNDLKGAYEYLMYFYYNKKDKENMKAYMDKIKEIDPNNKSVKEIEDAEKSAGAPKKAAPAKPKK